MSKVHLFKKEKTTKNQPNNESFIDWFASWTTSREKRGILLGGELTTRRRRCSKSFSLPWFVHPAPSVAAKKRMDGENFYMVQEMTETTLIRDSLDGPQAVEMGGMCQEGRVDLTF